MTAHEELTEGIEASFNEVGFEVGIALENALSPDLWLRYGLEMGWVERTHDMTCDIAIYHAGGGNYELVDPVCDCGGAYRFTAGAEKEGDR